MVGFGTDSTDSQLLLASAVVTIGTGAFAIGYPTGYSGIYSDGITRGHSSTSRLMGLGLLALGADALASRSGDLGSRKRLLKSRGAFHAVSGALVAAELLDGRARQTPATLGTVAVGAALGAACLMRGLNK